MSSDAQIKKRRDNKKKRKDDVDIEEKENLLQEQALSYNIPKVPKATTNGDLNIHVHKEPSTGGGLCAKLIFFILLTILTGLIALLVNEHRENVELEVSDTSRYSKLVQRSIDELAASVEESEETTYEEDKSEEEDEEQQSAESDDITSTEEGGDNVDEPSESDQENIEEDENVTPDETGELSEELPEEADDDGQNVDEDETELPDDSASQDSIDNDEDNENDDNSEEIGTIVPAEPSELPDETTTDELEKKSSQMVIKFGVGSALVVVAYIVLVQKWRTVADNIIEKKVITNKNEGESGTPNLSRRNTIVIPPSLTDVQHDIKNIEEEYPDDNADSDSDENFRLKPTQAQKRYQDLQSTYSSKLSPYWEPRELREKLMKNYEADEETGEEEEEDESRAEYKDEDEEIDEEEAVDEDDVIEQDSDDFEEDISEDEDAELLKRLEKKYGKLQQSDNDDEDVLVLDEDEDFHSWKRVSINQGDSDSENSQESDGKDPVYKLSDITNSDDWSIKEKLDLANQTVENDAAYALILFNKLLKKNPFSPRALYGKAYSLDILADQNRSNNLLQQAITTLQDVLHLPNVPDLLFQLVAERCINRMRFRGHYSQAVPIHTLLIAKFPREIQYRNELTVTYLTMNKAIEAKQVLKETLKMWPDNGFALVHYGFVLKTTNDDLEQAVTFLDRGISTREAGVIDGRFYFHLGDALSRLGRKEEALAVYDDGVVNGLFLSRYQRSLYNVDRLTAKPWWSKNDFPQSTFLEYLEKNWQFIRNEGLGILNKEGYFKPEAENLRDVGEWKQFELYARGVKHTANCRQCPMTCKMLDHFPEATTCRRGQIKFSVMHPGTHVWPHCGPTNCRLRIHLGLKVPLNTYIRVADEIRSWEEGQLLIFDDSFEHEVWHNGTSVRLVLIIDIWHPELTKPEKQSLTSI